MRSASSALFGAYKTAAETRSSYPHISSESSLWKGGLCQLSVEIRVYFEVTESLLGGREIFRDAEARSLEQSCHLVGVEKGFQG